MAKPLATAFPRYCPTVGALAKAAVGLNHAKLTAKIGPPRERELREALRYLIADVTGIEPGMLIGEDPRLIDLVLANDGLRAGV